MTNIQWTKFEQKSIVITLRNMFNFGKENFVFPFQK